MSEANRFKQMGVVSGIPDLICLAPTMAFELKASGGRLSDTQKDIIEKYKSVGIPVYVIKDAETFRDIIRKAWGDDD